MKWFEEIIKKIPIIDIFMLLFIATSILLFNPFDLIGTLKMGLFVEKYQIFFGISFIISSSFLTIVILKYLISFVKRFIINPFLTRYNVKKLSKEEIEFLSEYFYSEESKKFLISSYAPWSNGYTNSLMGKHIIYWSGGSSALVEVIGMEQCVPFNITHHAYKFLNKTIKKTKEINNKRRKR